MNELAAFPFLGLLARNELAALPFLLLLLLLSLLVACVMEKQIQEKAARAADDCKWQAFTLLADALERFSCKAPGDEVTEAVILATKKVEDADRQPATGLHQKPTAQTISRRSQ